MAICMYTFADLRLGRGRTGPHENAQPDMHNDRPFGTNVGDGSGHWLSCAIFVALLLTIFVPWSIGIATVLRALGACRPH
jgi:hypothetical protein